MLNVSSPSSRRAWIEICPQLLFGKLCYVALLAEGVDRNRDQNVDNPAVNVALLAEGVDRNKIALTDERNIMVALLAEGVDRNFFYLVVDVATVVSPSSRRAWIEM